MTVYECPFCGKPGNGFESERPLFRTERVDGPEGIAGHMALRHPIRFVLSQFDPDMSDALDDRRALPEEARCRHCQAMVKRGTLLDHLLEVHHDMDMFEELKTERK